MPYDTNIYNIPPPPENFIEAGKRPLSSMVPTIGIDDEGDVRLVIGAAGGKRITTAVAQVSYFYVPSVNKKKMPSQRFNSIQNSND